jgi:hypothetical protein
MEHIHTLHTETLNTILLLFFPVFFNVLGVLMVDVYMYQMVDNCEWLQPNASLYSLM